MNNIALQLALLAPGSVGAGANVLFDTTLFSTGGISYDKATGILTLTEAGRYAFDWWVATQSSASADGAVFAVSVSGGGTIMGCSPQKAGQVSGFAVIEVTTPPAQVSLTNESAAAYFYAGAVPVKASLFARNGLENLMDGNNTGALRGIGARSDYTMGQYAVALGLDTTASGQASHAEGNNSVASNSYAHAEGYQATASGQASHAEGNNSVASDQTSHAEGFSTQASGSASHAEGIGTTASGTASHAEGNNSIASGYHSHAEGIGGIALGFASHAEGYQTTASGIASHTEGNSSVASDFYAHAEGYQTTASNISSHTEGIGTTASGQASHAEGNNCVASGYYSHAEGLNTNTNIHTGAHIMGQYGSADADYSWFLANGSSGAPGLAAKILANGEGHADAWIAGGADYAEMFETMDANPIEPGYFVTFESGEKIRKAADTDGYILGVSAAGSGYVGDTSELHWNHKYLADEWERMRYHEVEVPAVLDGNGAVQVPAHIEVQPMLNPEWDAGKEYIPRAKRPEWVPVGLLGKLLVRDDGTCVPDGYCMPDAQGIATLAPSGCRVIKRTGENQVRIMLK